MKSADKSCSALSSLSTGFSEECGISVTPSQRPSCSDIPFITSLHKPWTGIPAFNRYIYGLGNKFKGTCCTKVGQSLNQWLLDWSCTDCFHWGILLKRDWWIVTKIVMHGQDLYKTLGLGFQRNHLLKGYQPSSKEFQNRLCVNLNMKNKTKQKPQAPQTPKI